MRVGIIVSSIDETSGGAHTITSNLLSALQNWNRHNSQIEIFLILSQVRQRRDKVDPSKEFHIIYSPNKVLRRILRIKWLFSNLLLYVFFRRKFDFRASRSASLNRLISKNNLHVVWSTEPLSFALEVPYINTVWDVAHRTSPYFPEVSNRFQWHIRELNNTEAIQRAYLNVVGTEVGASELIRAYGIDRERILVNPFPVPNVESLGDFPERVLGTFFYPAQFWPHKNHATLIRAMKILKGKTELDVQLTLTGADKGNLEFIKTLISELNLGDCVSLEGFVSKNRVNELYQTCGLFVFPTLIGPDNLPPLEAIAYGAPLLISRFPGSVEQIGAAAKYFDPLNPQELADLMLLSIENPQEWKENQEKAAAIRDTRRYDNYLSKVLERLELLTEVRSVWP